MFYEYTLCLKSMTNLFKTLYHFLIKFSVHQHYLLKISFWFLLSTILVIITSGIHQSLDNLLNRIHTVMNSVSQHTSRTSKLCTETRLLLPPQRFGCILCFRRHYFFNYSTRTVLPFRSPFPMRKYFKGTVPLDENIKIKLVE